LEIIDRVYEVAWAQAQARQPHRDTVLDRERQEALRKKIFGVARILGSGHIDFDVLAEFVLATITERSTRKRDQHVSAAGVTRSVKGRPQAA
jgi:hypothetical protein